MPNSDVSSLGGGVLLRTTQASFDVREESDVIALLRVIHVNTIDPDIKNHLRDLIFAYRQSMTASNLELLITAFGELGILVVSDENVPTAEKLISVTPQKKSSYFSTSRPQPRFVGVVTKPTVKSVVEPIGVPSYNSEPVAITPIPVPDQVVVVAPQSVIPPADRILPSTDISEQENETLASDVAPVPTLSVSTYANPADRIKEIKHQVNEKVGNPINLIDAHNEIGREYMNALLDAMKKSNGGQAAEVNEAMVRLEKAFVAVFDAIGQGSTPTASIVQPEAQVESEVFVKAEPMATVSATPVSSEQKQVDTSSNAVKIKIVQEPVVAMPEVIAPVEAIEETVVPMTPTSRLASVAENLGAAIVPKNAEVDRTPVQSSVESQSNPNFHSVAEDKSLQDSVRLQREDISKQLRNEEAIKVSQMDPLQTPEVTAGLGQLLSEWSLFKSSGIFGTGPSGKDHVLYLKLAPLTMSVVIAGRFEGVTPKIKQSIADYMNGWRYEEGVTHEHGETFEHYLRRVIHHILNKQKQAG